MRQLSFFNNIDRFFFFFFNSFFLPFFTL